ncbi:hypothetical protein HAX54_046569, partial [Datura stramonium]|nr:hypothetical protein [Datura stramonium]
EGSSLSQAQIELESELERARLSLIAQSEKNTALHEELMRVKNDLDKSLRWT